MLSLRDSRTAQNINLSITNNFNNSTINISNNDRNRSCGSGNDQLLNKKKKSKQRIIEEKVNRETGCNFKPKINKNKLSTFKDKARNIKKSNTVRSMTPRKTEYRNSSLQFHPKIHNNSRKMVNK
jgi:NCAIR mutase (PurE)-related protein